MMDDVKLYLNGTRIGTATHVEYVADEVSAQPAHDAEALAEALSKRRVWPAKATGGRLFVWPQGGEDHEAE